MTAKFAVVGCGQHGCHELFVIRLNGQRTTHCTRCGRRYSRESRTHLAEADTLQDAQVARGQLLRERSR